MRSLQKLTIAFAAGSFAGLGALSGSATAAPINLSFNNAATGVAPNTDGIIFTDDTGVWTQYTGAGTMAGGLTFTVTGTFFNFGSGTGVRDQVIFNNSTTLTWSITGLTPGGEYDMVFLAQTGPANRSAWTIATGTGVGVGDSELDYNFAGAVADGTGTLGGTWGAGPGAFNFAWAGIQIDAVPEPASLALLGIGSVAMFSGRSRKRS